MTSQRPTARRAHAVAAVVGLSVLLAACAPSTGAAPDEVSTSTVEPAVPSAPAAPSALAAPSAPAAPPEPTLAPDVPGQPTEQPGPRLVLATEAASDSLSIVDPSLPGPEAVVDRVVVGEAPWGVAVDDASDRAVVSTAEGVAVVDLGSRTRTALIPYRDQPSSVRYGEYRPGGLGIALSPDGSTAYVAVSTGRSATLETVDLTTSTVVSSTPVGLRPFDVLVSADGTEVYTVDHDSFSVHVVETATGQARRIEVAPFGTHGGLASWEKPHYAALDEDGTLLLPYQGTALVRLDPRTGQTSTATSTADSHQHGTALTDDGRLVTIGNGSFGTATGGPNVSVRTLATGEETVVDLDRQHETVALWTDPTSGATHAVLSGGYTQPGAWEGLTLVDLTTMQTREVPVSGRPQDLATYSPGVGTGAATD